MFRLGGKLVIGVVHLLPLPGSPAYGGNRQAIRTAARRDATAYLEGGCHGIIVENHGDGPFFKNDVGPAVVAEMTHAAAAVVSLLDDRHCLGINVLRNDASAALSIAAAVGAHFIRVNVHTGSMYTDQGLIEGRAAETLRLRRALETDVAIFADIAVKHAIPPAGFDRARAARDCVGRGGADGLIVTGAATGAPTSEGEILEVKSAAPKHPILVGSGVTAATVGPLLGIADGVIVGTSLKEGGDVHNPVDAKRVAEFVRNAT
ncbi:MAG: BtpA/SgcQ family protein [Planctomycetota bacterium]